MLIPIGNNKCEKMDFLAIFAWCTLHKYFCTIDNDEMLNFVQGFNSIHGMVSANYVYCRNIAFQIRSLVLSLRMNK